MALLLDGLGNRAVATSAGLHALAVDARGMRRREAALSGLLPAIVVYVFDVEGMQVAGKVSENREADVDKEISSATCDGVDTEGRQEDGDEHQENG